MSIEIQTDNSAIAPNEAAILTRSRIARAIEGLLTLLDQMDGDADLEETGDDEPYMSSGAALWSTSGGQRDLEEDIEFDDNQGFIPGGQRL